MQVLLAGDRDSVVAEVRRVLLREGLECPAAHVVGLGAMIEGLARVKPELLLLVLSPNPDLALSVLDQARSDARGRVVVIGPSTDPKLVVRALRGGADDYVDEEEIEADLEAALGRFKRELATRTTEEARVIAVLAPSGGSGSSTIAANVATMLAKQHKT